MDFNNSIRSRMIGRTFGLLTRALDYHSANQQVIAGNLSNIDTPGYQPKDLRFDQVLEQAAGNLKLEKTSPGHLPPSTPPGNGFSLVKRKTGPVGSDQSNLDHEMARMMKNNLLYEASARLMAKKIQALKTVISQGRS